MAMVRERCLLDIERTMRKNEEKTKEEHYFFFGVSLAFLTTFATTFSTFAVE